MRLFLINLACGVMVGGFYLLLGLLGVEVRLAELPGVIIGGTIGACVYDYVKLRILNAYKRKPTDSEPSDRDVES